MKRKVKSVAKILLRPGTRRHLVVRTLMLRLGLIKPAPRDIQYLEWVEFTEPYLALVTEDKEINYRPLISVVVPVFNVPANYFYPMVYSVVNQTYDNWELLLINASSDTRCREMTRQAVNIDTRIRIIELEKNKGIAKNTNAGLAKARGEYVALLDHDDLYVPDALKSAVYVMQGGVKPALIYSDEDKLSANGEERFDPNFKSAWDINLFRQVNYLNHLTVLRKDVLDKIGGYRTGFDGAQDYDLYLRVIDATGGNVAHIPRVLYHWRAAATSTAQNFSVKKNILNAGRRALQDHLERNNLDGEVRAIRNQPGFYRIQYNLPKKLPHVLIVCASALSKDQMQEYLSQLVSMTSYGGRLTLLSQDISLFPEMPNEIADFDHQQYSSEDNLQVKLGKVIDNSSILVKVDAAVIPRSKKWLEELVGCLAQLDSMGAITPLTLVGESQVIHDFGYFGDSKARLVAPFKGMREGAHTYIGNSNWTRELRGLGSCIIATRSSLYIKYIDTHQVFSVESFSRYILSQNLAILAWPFAKFSYYGHINNSVVEEPSFNSLFNIVENRFTLTKTINVPTRIVK